MNHNEIKKVITYLFDEFIQHLDEVNSPERLYRDYETIDDLISMYTHWDVDMLANAIRVHLQNEKREEVVSVKVNKKDYTVVIRSLS